MVMATILSSSDTASLNSVVICCAAVTTLSILSRVGLLTIGVELTDLLLAAMPKLGYSILLLRVDLPQEPGLD
jgi:hypothetical protein